MSARHFLPKLFASGLLIAAALAPAAAQATAPATTGGLPLTAELLLTPEFCNTEFKKGSWATIKENFHVGATACSEIENGLTPVFSKLTRVESPPTPLDAQILLTPRFVDVAATTGVTAFSNRELHVVVEWTAKDASGKLVWIETVEGTATRHMGNVFTYNKNLHHIVDEAIQDAVARAADKMLASRELQKLGNPPSGDTR